MFRWKERKQEKTQRKPISKQKKRHRGGLIHAVQQPRSCDKKMSNVR